MINDVKHFYMIVGHLEKCLFKLFAYFKIRLLLMSHRSPLHTVSTIFSYSVSSLWLILSVFVCKNGCFISSSLTQKVAFNFTCSIFLFFPPKITMQYRNFILAHRDSYSHLSLPQCLSPCL